jgi:hypothetical protein
MLESNDFSNYVVARLQDFFRPNDRWFRGLWDVGAVLSLRELLEASEAASTGVLSEGSVSWLASDIKEALKSDAGVPRWAMQDLLSCFKHPLQYRDAHWHSLVDLTERDQRGLPEPVRRRDRGSAEERKVRLAAAGANRAIRCFASARHWILTPVSRCVA